LSLKEEDVNLLEELFVQEGIIFDPDTVMLDIDSVCHDAASQQIALLVEAVGELTETVQEVYTAPTKPASILLLLSCSLQGGNSVCRSCSSLTRTRG
jgi:kinesin family protein 5